MQSYLESARNCCVSTVYAKSKFVDITETIAILRLARSSAASSASSCLSSKSAALYSHTFLTSFSQLHQRLVTAFLTGTGEPDFLSHRFLTGFSQLHHRLVTAVLTDTGEPDFLSHRFLTASVKAHDVAWRPMRPLPTIKAPIVGFAY